MIDSIQMIRVLIILKKNKMCVCVCVCVWFNKSLFSPPERDSSLVWRNACVVVRRRRHGEYLLWCTLWFKTIHNEFEWLCFLTIFISYFFLSVLTIFSSSNEEEEDISRRYTRYVLATVYIHRDHRSYSRATPLLS